METGFWWGGSVIHYQRLLFIRERRNLKEFFVDTLPLTADMPVGSLELI